MAFRYTISSDGFAAVRCDGSVAMRGRVTDGAVEVTHSSEPSPSLGEVLAVLFPPPPLPELQPADVVEVEPVVAPTPAPPLSRIRRRSRRGGVTEVE